VKKMIIVLGCALFMAMAVYAAKKNVMHVIDQSICNQCGKCVKACTEKAIKVMTKDGKKIHWIDPALCNQCGLCIEDCPEEAIQVEVKKKVKKK
jgi:NAD-dependent dihydropyrimidine dehydrogenase PreA subunit